MMSIFLLNVCTIGCTGCERHAGYGGEALSTTDHMLQAAAEVIPSSNAALARTVGAYIGIGSADCDALCRQHGVYAGAMRRPLCLQPTVCNMQQLMQQEVPIARARKPLSCTDA